MMMLPWFISQRWCSCRQEMEFRFSDEDVLMLFIEQYESKFIALVHDTWFFRQCKRSTKNKTTRATSGRRHKVV